jgi:hypothetical protein
MSVLTMVQNACNDLGLSEPSAVVTSTNRLTLQLLRSLNRASFLARSMYSWPELVKECALTLVADQANYALPSDLFKRRFETEWDRSAYWPVAGPYTAQQWQELEHGLGGSTSVYPTYRIQGFADRQFYLTPTPTAGDAGQIVSFEYQTAQWFLPRVWAASQSVVSGNYGSYNGNVYTAGSTGTTGATPPTHTTGAVSDGSITWTYVSTPYLTMTSDNDWSVIDEELLTQGLVWVFKRSKGLDYAEEKRDWIYELRRAVSRKAGAKTLTLHRARRKLLNANIPETGFGL